MKAFTTGPFTGRHIAMIMVAFFAVVIAVNLLMARFAISTFGGVVVENSYVASQHFNTWLDEAEREKALGWNAEAQRLKDGRLAVRLTGAPGEGVILSADARHPLGRLPDQLLRFQRQADGRFVSQQALPAGRWRLRIEATAGAQRWRTEQEVL
ncbi:MAG: Integral rane protein linked to a cation pump-like protein [Pseudomonadota bacterium]|nr:FixH family protein [Novosphingobium sp.]HOA49260.1 FixH family protein [Novosphingobium sp.]HPB21330.1 FixH family protein [Novosphingobium sp.]HPZ47117.1 FixH family protein [Novosphingobium sp.]HQD99985.1 FixH family protein [Novosphingobium sp.]